MCKDKRKEKERPKKGKGKGKPKPPKKKKAPEAEPEVDMEPEEVETAEAAELAEAIPEDVPILMTLAESATCNICLGAIKTGLPVVKCVCGKKYHESCATRVGACPSCDVDITNPTSIIPEEDDNEMTDDDE